MCETVPLENKQLMNFTVAYQYIVVYTFLITNSFTCVAVCFNEPSENYV